MRRDPRDLFSPRGLLLVAGFSCMLLAACNDEDTTAPDRSGTFVGQTWAVGNGTARTWVTLDAAGRPTALGVTLSENALTNLPDAETEFSFELPAEAGATPFRHVGLNWNPQGHVPPGIYNVPHFDVHFYMISEAQRYAITGTGTDSLRLYRAPGPEYLPADYINPPGAGEPRMGNHWVDPTSPEFNGMPFTRTFIYGSYDGQVTFWEPMITKDYLETQPSATQDIKQPQRYSEGGRYFPTRYTVRFDTVAREYRISLDGLVLR